METQVFSARLFQEQAQGEKTAQEVRDLGFGEEVTGKSRKRLLNRDGTFNVRREGYNLFRSRSLYHFFLSVSWPKFLLIVVCIYLVLNLFFAAAFFLCGPGALQGATGLSAGERFADSFFFSIQTFATLGYGRIAPQGFFPNLLVTIEVFVGLLSFALGTGLCFTRFSRPTARITFSKNAVISPYKDKNALQFRIVNERANQIIHLEARLVMSWLDWDGRMLRRRFRELELERRQVMFFPLHWTIVHLIDKDSPLCGFTQKDLQASDAEFLVLLDGIDDAFSQAVHARTSYKFEEVLWDAKFSGLLEESPDGTVKIDLRRIHDIEQSGPKRAVG